MPQEFAYGIYTLADPRNHIVRYVGISNNPLRRYTEHINNNDSFAKSAWIAGLAQSEIVPDVHIIDTAQSWKEGLHLEAYWIDYYSTHGAPLLNKVRPTLPQAGKAYQAIQLAEGMRTQKAEALVDEITRCIVQGRFKDIQIKHLAILAQFFEAQINFTDAFLSPIEGRELRNTSPFNISHEEIEAYEASLKQE